MFKYRSQSRFVDKEGRLQPEAYAALAPSQKKALEFTAQAFVADEQATVYLPSVQAVNFTRDGTTTAITGSMVVVNPGDALALGSAQLIKFVPL